MIVANPLVLDTIHQRETLASVDLLGGDLDEALRIPLEFFEAVAADKYLLDASTRELGLMLEFGKDVRQQNVRFIQGDRASHFALRCLDARVADGDIGLSPV